MLATSQYQRRTAGLPCALSYIWSYERLPLYERHD